jgi:hypothetical protein
MMFYYSDANPFLRWVDAQIPGATDDCQQVARELKRIVENPEDILALSETTIAEFHSNLFKLERESSNFDPANVDKCLDQFMEWMLRYQIQVIIPTPKLVEKAMAYVRLATRSKKCALKAWDAVHLVEANEWAHSLNMPVSIITNDKVFSNFLRFFPEFVEFIRIYDPLRRKFYPMKP